MYNYNTSCTSGSGGRLVGQLYLGCCGGGSTTGSVLTYYNVTSPTPVPLPGDGTGPSGCDCSYPCDAGCDPSASGSVWASAFYPGEEYWTNTSSNQDMLTVQSFASGTTQSYGGTVGGFKNVAAHLQWYGCFGFTDNDSCSQSTSIAPNQTKYTSATVAGSLVNSSVGAEYKSNSSVSIGGVISVNTTTGIISSSLVSAEDDYTENETSAGPPPVYSAPIHTYHSYGGAGYTSNGVTTINYSNGMSTPLDVVIDVHCSGSQVFYLSVAPKVSSWNINAANIATGSMGDPYPPTINYLPTVSNPFSYSASALIVEFEQTSGSAIYSESMACSIVGSNTSFSEVVIYTSWTDNGPSLPAYIDNSDYQYSISLGGANTAASVVGGCNSLLGTWNLANNSVYPFRTDDFTSIMPLVTERQVQADISPMQPFNAYTMNDYRNPVSDANGNAPFTTANPTPPAGWTYAPLNNDCDARVHTDPSWSGPCDWMQTYSQIAWQDPNSYIWVWDSTYADGYKALSMNNRHFDGAIIGAPLLEASGSAVGFGWFDFYGRQLDFCMAGTECPIPYPEFIYSYGGTLADLYVSVSAPSSGAQLSTFLPMATTHATDNLFSHGLSRGAQISTGLASDGVTVVKWAEEKIPVQHHNYYRPCGSDRVLIDKTKTQCFTAYPIMAGSISGLSGGSQVLVNNTGATDGIFTGCSQTIIGAGPTYTFVPGTLVSALPTDYSRQLSGYGAVAGIVRFPSAWPICGEAAATFTVTGSNTLITTLAPQTNLRTGDHVDLWNNTASVITSQSVIRTDDTHFIIPIIVTGSVEFIKSTGSPDLGWYDSSPKQEYRVGQWSNSNRNNSFNNTGPCTQSCVNAGACSTPVVYLSPNSESVNNCYWFSGSFQVDEIYGSIQNMNVEFWMQDPLWQAPYCPSACNIMLTCTSDNMSCLADTTDGSGNITAYYSYPDQCEAVCSAPSGSPALPSGCSIPAMTCPSIAGFPGGPGYNYNFNPHENWILTSNFLSASGSCRFNYDWLLI